MTTAQLRNAARDAANLCNWQEAANLMAEAIDKYPGNKASPLVQADIAAMTQRKAGYLAAAKGLAA